VRAEKFIRQQTILNALGTKESSFLQQYTDFLKNESMEEQSSSGKGYQDEQYAK
jgi:hypothetical protein